MICIVALPVLLILGIFSMRYRILAKEAFDCIFTMVTFRPCRSKLDQRIKAGVTGKLMKYHPGFAKFIFKNFEILSWIFVALFALSLVFSALGIVNYALYGNCNGPQPGAFCIINEIRNGVESAITTTNCTNVTNAAHAVIRSANAS